MDKRIHLLLLCVLLIFGTIIPVYADEQNAQAGEKINWQNSGPGLRSTSATYRLASSVGQTAAGRSTSATYGTNSGYQQSFEFDCCEGIRGNVNGFGGVNIQDVTYLVAFLFQGGPIYLCEPEANLNGFGIVNVQDLTYLVSYLFAGGSTPPACP
jgi:hypothetical protein